MKLVRVDGLLDQLDDFILQCCINGDFQPEPAIQYMSASSKNLSLIEENPYPPMVQAIEELFSLTGYVPPEEDTASQEKEIAPDVLECIQQLKEKLEVLQKQKRACQRKMEEIEERYNQYSHFESLEPPLEDIKASEYIKIRFGFLPGESYQKLQTNYADDPYIFFVPCSEENGGYWGLYFTPHQAADEIDGIFSMLYFERIQLKDDTGTIKEIMQKLKSEAEVVQKELDQTNQSIEELWQQNKERCTQVYSQLKWLEQVFELRHYAAYRDNYFFYVGWIPERAVKEFTQKVKTLSNMKITITDPSKQDKIAPPIKLKNILPFRPFETFVSMYGLPSYGEMDITQFVAITFTLLFGMMFGDMGQGAVLAIGAFILYKWKKLELAKLVIPCGISSMIFGSVFGSVFGFEHALDPVYHALGWEGKPLEVMGSINTVLLMAIGIGVSLVALSILLNIIASARKGLWGEAIFSNNGIVGLAVYLCGVNVASGFMKGPNPIPSAVAGIIIGIGLVLLFFKEVLIGKIDHHPNWKPESWVDYSMQNVFELLEYVLSYFSNTVSFLRVGAFVIVHAAMMMVVFSLAGEPANPIVVVLGNALVICLEGLLSGIQGLRLEFYEMFSRCYQGGGRPFHGVSLTPVKDKKKS